ncbi:MAG: transposase [Candidatus Aminicenantes bacterium]|nr:MAG: transposase [Candidatus Aminicenantes bacterium]
MRRERITYTGAYHHVMNRGYDGNDIFAGNKDKNQFLVYLEDAAKKMKIRLFAYCIMDNHYHLVLENSSGRMSDCLKLLNGQYGMYYRKMFGGKGYVFQSRFKSTIIENDGYLIKSIEYLLQNPVRAGIVSRAESYIWSSIQHYFSNQTPEIVDADYVNQLFGTRKGLLAELESMGKKKLSVTLTKHGEVFGSMGFLKLALKKHNRRKKPSDQSIGTQRKDDRFFEPVEKVLWEFRNIHGVDLDDIDTRTWEGKRLRVELLVLLREKAGLKYKDISEFDVFCDLSFSSLRSLYYMSRQRQKKDSLGN